MARTLPDPQRSVIADSLQPEAGNGTGYVSAHIPAANPVAPHMVDNKYFGRGDQVFHLHSLLDTATGS
ncbi:hypothetical protein [Streptomyces sp. NPDC054838]